MHIVLACIKFNITQVSINVLTNNPKLLVFAPFVFAFNDLLLIFGGQSESYSVQCTKPIM